MKKTIGLSCLLLSVLFLFNSCTEDSNNVQTPITKVDYFTIQNVKVSTDLAIPHDFYWIDGAEKSFLNETKGKVVILNFWATWCSSCVSELPVLMQINEEYKNKDVVVVGVNLDIDHLKTSMTVEKLKQIVKEKLNGKSFNFINFFDYYDQLSVAYNIYGIPRTIIINKQGKIALDNAGEMDYDILKNHLDNILAPIGK